MQTGLNRFAPESPRACLKNKFEQSSWSSSFSSSDFAGRFENQSDEESSSLILARKPELGSTPVSGRCWTRLASSPFVRGSFQNARNFFACPMFSARERKTAREARALPIQLRFSGLEVFAINKG